YVAKIENLDRRIDILELMDWLECLNSNIDEFLK
ncbi:XRE family transcriptional regulator, partial [Acinetobacter baumannii]